MSDSSLLSDNKHGNTYPLTDIARLWVQMSELKSLTLPSDLVELNENPSLRKEFRPFLGKSFNLVLETMDVPHKNIEGPQSPSSVLFYSPTQYRTA